MDETIEIYIDNIFSEFGKYSIQLCTNSMSVTLIAKDLLFLDKILVFVKETLNNPKYRDNEITDNYFKRMPKKSLDISGSFPSIYIELEKDGEFDDRYIFHLNVEEKMQINFDISGNFLNDFLDKLGELKEEYGYN